MNFGESSVWLGDKVCTRKTIKEKEHSMITELLLYDASSNILIYSYSIIDNEAKKNTKY